MELTFTVTCAERNLTFHNSNAIEPIIMTRSVQILITCTILILLLSWGKSVLIPLSFSLLIACILYPFCKWLEQRGLPAEAAIFIGLGMLAAGASALVGLLVWQISGFASEWGKLQSKLNESWAQLSNWLSNNANITPEEQQLWLGSMQSDYGDKMHSM